MGFSTLIDILGSTVIGGLLLLILFRMNDTAVENNYVYSGERIVQQNLVEIVKLLEYDFRKIGYCYDWTKLSDPSMIILAATNNRITFLTDFLSSANPYGDGIVDTLTYYLGNKSDLTVTPNPNDMILYRLENQTNLVSSGNAKGSNLGVTEFNLTYFDASGDRITNLPKAPPFGIASIQLDIAVENPAAYGNDYSVDRKVIWRQIRLASRNFMIR
jgi:type II secretory pathway component PulJ